MGVKVKATEKKVAFVRCSGTCDVTHSRANYIGIQDCRSALNAGLSVGDCEYGCMGYGTCTQVCPENAIHVENGVAVVRKMFESGVLLENGEVMGKNLTDEDWKNMESMVDAANRPDVDFIQMADSLDEYSGPEA